MCYLLLTLWLILFPLTLAGGSQGTKIWNIIHLVPRWVVFRWSEKNLEPRLLKFDFRPFFYKNACVILCIVFLILILYLQCVIDIYVHLIWNIPKFGYTNSKYLIIEITWIRNTCWFLFTHFHWIIWKIWKQLTTVLLFLSLYRHNTTIAIEESFS